MLRTVSPPDLVDQVRFPAYRRGVTEAVPLSEAKTRLSELVRRVEAGEEIVIRRGRTPVVRLVAVRPARIAAPGALRGRVRIDDDFDGPLEDFDAYRDASG